MTSSHQCDDIQAKLSDYVDRTLDRPQTDVVQAHLSVCDACRGVADDLDRLRGVARGLGPITPPAHIWLEIAGRVRLEDPASDASPTATAIPSPVSRTSDTWQWLGLAAALVIATLGVYSLAQPGAANAPTTLSTDASNASGTPTVETVTETMGRAVAEWELAIAQLEEVVKNDKAALPADAEAVANLQKSLTAADSAIAESRAALSSSPSSQPARTSLFEALRSKVSILQHTVVLMNEMRKGDAAGAADAAGINKTS